MEEEEGKGLGDYLDIIRRRKYWVIFPALILMVLSTVLAYWLPATYKSEGLILIESQEIPNDLVRSTVTSYAEQRIAVIKQKLMTTPKVLALIEKHNLYAIQRTEKYTQAAIVARFRANVAVDMVQANVADSSGRRKSASIAFKVGFSDNSPQVAQVIANDLITSFLNENVRIRTERAGKTKDFLKVEGDKFQKKLQQIEKQIGEFKDEYSDSLPELLQYNLSAVERLQNELLTNQNSILLLKDQITTMSLQLTAIPAYLEESSIPNISGDTIGSPDEQLTQLTNKYNILIGKYSTSHPDIVSLKRQISQLETEIADAPRVSERLDTKNSTTNVNPIYVQIKGRMDSAESEIIRIRARQGNVKKKLAEYEKRVFKTHQVKRVYDDLTRDHENTKAKYKDLRAKQLEAELAENLESQNKGESFSLIEPPLVPKKAEKPNRKKLMMMGFVVSIGSGIGLAILMELLFGGVRGYTEITRIAGRSPLVVIPIISTKLDIKRQKTVRNKWLFLLFIASIAMVVIFHVFVMNLEVLWFKMMQKASHL